VQTTTYVFWPVYGYSGDIRMTTFSTNDTDGESISRGITPATYDRFTRIANSGKYNIAFAEHGIFNNISWLMTVPTREVRRAETAYECAHAESRNMPQEAAGLSIEGVVIDGRVTPPDEERSVLP
jgi:hypothetical protein